MEGVNYTFIFNSLRGDIFGVRASVFLRYFMARAKMLCLTQ